MLEEIRELLSISVRKVRGFCVSGKTLKEESPDRSDVETWRYFRCYLFRFAKNAESITDVRELPKQRRVQNICGNRPNNEQVKVIRSDVKLLPMTRTPQFDFRTLYLQRFAKIRRVHNYAQSRRHGGLWWA